MPTPQYNQDEMWKIYEKLPEELKQAVFSAENADHTFSICERYGINECPKVASLIGLVLMGVMLPRNFEGALAKEMGLDNDTAQRVSQEVNRFIFYPVKQQLEQLHAKPGEVGTPQEVGIATPRHSDERRASDYIVETEEKPEPQEAFREEKKGSDTYREPTE
ncbi:MAG: hypothetical protein A2940_00175 [Candidatus Wildermuthbacteria bacterium RIFCSPLOWO2_01_FULL_48_29]|uniref:Uncharacterized protein n=2 Tax=Candidatus Wildermuthiibacteriota TaxID=1817923 RepID=A0A1G2RN53_9BACT|nr:MAG: hypothetical protein A2843_01625 [Candidatus Wildermuthbacteria bacterium RIFCSPHIGHO2_01_FULL_48_27b]OHA73928.1 MAG: hypothetical protein A2940_00175 [Candidatus Wildermuthbacteria bacterium RIFCSPLOWO2_01_FULL_48_29]